MPFRLTKEISPGQRRAIQTHILCRFAAALLVPAALAASGTVAATYVAALPSGATVRAMAVDAKGNLLVSGGAPNTNDAFVARVSADGQTLAFYAVVYGGSDTAVALALDAAGNALVAGGDFVVKVDPSGNPLNTTYFGGGRISGIALAANGDVFLTGYLNSGTAFPTVPGVLQNLNTGFFTSRLSADLSKILYYVPGIGGTAIAVDGAGDAYVAGTYPGSFGYSVPITAGAYQTAAAGTTCAAGMMFAIPCNDQFLAKLDPTGSKLLFCTFLSGGNEQNVAGVAVDANGNVYVAGTTGSTSYPVTSGAAETQNSSTLPPQAMDANPIEGIQEPFPYTGYVSKLSSDGTQLIWSTFLGGSQADRITAMALNPAGQVTVLTRAESPDFPGLPQAATRCLPDRLHDIPVVAMLSAAGDAVVSTVVVEGVTPGESELGVALDGQGGALVLTGGSYVADTGAAGSGDAIGCVTDAFDYTMAGTVSPGEMLTIFGAGLASGQASYDPTASMLPTALAGASVTINGVAAPLLYASPEQINLVVPYEAAGVSTATLEVQTASGATAHRTMLVATSTPSVATNGVTAYPVCNGQTLLGSTAALVLNEDYTPNSCANPARLGTLVRVFLNGVGPIGGAATGTIAQSTVPADVFVADFNNHLVQSAGSIPGAPIGMWEADIALPPNMYPVNTTLNISVGGVAVREGKIAVWAAQ